VGVTPLISILQAALDATPEREIVFIHGSLNEDVQAFHALLESLAAKQPRREVHHRYSDAGMRGGNSSTGLIDAELIESFLPGRDADYYFCGPQPFMVGIYHALLVWGLPASQVRFEFFGPRQELERPPQAA
jgi:nitric oxide dioxygenase